MARFVLISLAIVALVSIAGCESHSAEIKAATEVTDAWLKLLDQGSYGECWDQTGDAFKTMAPREPWSKQIEAMRTALGPMVSRSLKHSEYTTHVSGVAGSEFVILQYGTSFKNRAGLVEEVTSTRDKDGHWVPLGYYVK
jgi:hypothetical protein